MNDEQKISILMSPLNLSGSEMDYIREAITGNSISQSQGQIDAFEGAFSEMVGIPYAVAVSSSTAAMHLALRVLGTSPMDEVIASSMTCISTVSPIVYVGAAPVFIDSDRATWNMDPDLLAEELDACRKRGHMPKAVVPTDLYGHCADQDRILELCVQHDIPVIADSTEALGAFYKERSAGCGSKMAVYSFGNHSIVTTFGGGMLASNDQTLIKKARSLANQAMEPFNHVEHSEVGFSYRMSNILAAIGRAQLKKLSERVEQKRRIFRYYQEALADTPGIEFMPEAPYGRSNRWLTVILIDSRKFGADRETVRVTLESMQIESWPIWKPMHLQPVFQKYWICGGSISEDLSKRGLCLPSGTTMTNGDLERVVNVIKACCQR